MTLAKKVTILLVDDDEVQEIMLQRMLSRAKFEHPLRVARNGLEALDILRGSEGASPTNAYIVLLDLNMPLMDGHSFLAEIRQDDQLRGTVVFVLSSSDLESDILEAYEHSVAGYLTKANVGPDGRPLLDLLRTYSEVVEFPSAA